MEYQERLNKWARSLASPKQLTDLANYETRLGSPATAYIEVDDGGSGCSTCGYGGEGSMEVWIGNQIIQTYYFNNIDVMLQGLLAVEDD